MFSFRLRGEILFDGMVLRDPLTGAVYPLNQLGRNIIEALDARLSVEELLAKIVRLCSAHPARVERELRQILVLGLCEGTCSTIRERLERIRGGERLTTQVLEGSRFACQNSGECCRGYVFGSIREEEKRRIEALDPRKALPHLGDNPLFVEMGVSSSKPTYRLATAGDACVFLEDGSQCGLHRHFGASAKPALCQLYPLAAVATIDGLKIYDRGECATFAVSARTGSMLADDIPRVRALTDEDIYHPTVWIHGSWRCDYGLILTLARRLDYEARSKSPLQALHTIGHVARGFIVTLARCPFDSGQPEDAVVKALRNSAEEFSPSETTVAVNALTGLHRLASLTEGLLERVAREESFTPFFIEAGSFLVETCRSLLGGGPICERGRAALAIGMRVECEQALSLSLRQQLFGRDLLLDDNLPAGLLRMAFVATLTLAGARLRALDDGQRQVFPKHFSSAHMVTKRTLHRPEPHGLLRANSEQAWPILDALPVLDRDLGFSGVVAAIQ